MKVVTVFLKSGTIAIGHDSSEPRIEDVRTHVASPGAAKMIGFGDLIVRIEDIAAIRIEEAGNRLAPGKPNGAIQRYTASAPHHRERDR